LFRLNIRGQYVDLAYIEEYTMTRKHQLTGLQMLRHKYVQRKGTQTRALTVIPIKSIYCLAHVMPVFPKGDSLVGWNRWDVEERTDEFILNTDIDVGVRDFMTDRYY